MTAVTESIPCPIASLPLKQGYDRPFVPQAGIINVYQLKDALTAHVDRAEQNMEAPLVSLSFGHACVFLIGGVTRDIRPTAILLRSGDAVVLSGESRRAFHGVPRIIEDSLPSWFRQDITTQDCKTACDENDGLTEDQRALVYDFIQTARVNVNMRQVMLMTDLCGQ
jgi:alkylated DNA repair protein alkB family protein 1